jgi:osmotically-inducible protein OsmY
MPIEVTPDRIAVWHQDAAASDAVLRRAIEDDLRADPDANDAEISVAVGSDVVTLMGMVRTPSDRAHVLAAVRRSAGTRPVHDMIAMRHSNDGHQLRREVHEAISRSFHRTANVDLANVGIVCEAGTVCLTGRVQSLAARIGAENAAWATPGVRAVHNDIVVANSHAPSGLGGD